jgi:hypothetical protein
MPYKRTNLPKPGPRAMRTLTTTLHLTPPVAEEPQSLEEERRELLADLRALGGAVGGNDKPCACASTEPTTPPDPWAAGIADRRRALGLDADAGAKEDAERRSLASASFERNRRAAGKPSSEGPSAPNSYAPALRQRQLSLGLVAADAPVEPINDTARTSEDAAVDSHRQGLIDTILAGFPPGFTEADLSGWPVDALERIAAHYSPPEPAAGPAAPNSYAQGLATLRRQYALRVA